MFYLHTKKISEKITLKNLPTLRQAFVVAAFMTLAAFLLAEILHPDWIYLALLPAFGLLFSGLTGICPMVFILQVMPWNKRQQVTQDKTSK